MAIKQPGTQSTASLFSSGVVSIILLIILIGGHVILGYLVLSSVFGGGNLKSIATDTDIPAWGLILMVAGAVLMDAWIFYSMHKARKRRNAR